ncbi:MAG: Fe-S cluster biogenesis protein NfuA [Candidatus Omnitrophota bacterium]|jgi:Fe-S cluster biogenesis protein NfuA
MDIRIMVQSTPNPNALKFVLNIPMRTNGNVTYKSLAETENNPLARIVFEKSENITEVYFFDNYITVTQDGSADWDDLEETLRKSILDNAKDHNAGFYHEEPKAAELPIAKETPEIQRINAILNETIRPALQMDGGDLQIAGFTDNKLSIFYQGACGSCPSSTMGTLNAIENILKNEYDPDISVELAEL